MIYLIICTHHALHSSNEPTNPPLWDLYDGQSKRCILPGWISNRNMHRHLVCQPSFTEVAFLPVATFGMHLRIRNYGTLIVTIVLISTCGSVKFNFIQVQWADPSDYGSLLPDCLLWVILSGRFSMCCGARHVNNLMWIPNRFTSPTADVLPRCHVICFCFNKLKDTLQNGFHGVP